MSYQKIINEWLDRNQINSYYDRVVAAVQERMQGKKYSLYYLNDLRWLEKFLPNDDNQLVIIVHPFEIDQDMKYGLGIPFLPAGERQTVGLDLLLKTVNIYADKTFIVIQPSVDTYTGHDRLHFVHGGDQFLIQENQYPLLKPLVEKKLTEPYHAVFLSLQPKNHRVIAASYLINQQLLPTMLIRGSFLEWQSKPFWWRAAGYDKEPQLAIGKKIQQGYLHYIQGRHGGQPAGVVFSPERTGDNCWNFDQNLRPIYEHSLVEIVPETVFVPQSRLITEKFLHSVYACNLPIWVSTRWTVQHIRNLGFDVFDDYIDHSYDNCADPLERIVTAVDSNLKLLKERQHALKVWQILLHRMQKNIDHARKNVYNQAMAKFLLDFDQIILRRENA
jgi:hypothetical protein